MTSSCRHWTLNKLCSRKTKKNFFNPLRPERKADGFQTCSNAFLKWKWFRLKFHKCLFPKIDMTKEITGGVKGWRRTGAEPLDHWGRVKHICVSNLTIIGSDNGLSHSRRHYLNQCRIIVNWTPRKKFSEILIKSFSFKKMRLKMSSAKWRPFCLGLNVLTKPMMVLSIDICIHH